MCKGNVTVLKNLQKFNILQLIQNLIKIYNLARDKEFLQFNELFVESSETQTPED